MEVASERSEPRDDRRGLVECERRELASDADLGELLRRVPVRRFLARGADQRRHDHGEAPFDHLVRESGDERRDAGDLVDHDHTGTLASSKGLPSRPSGGELADHPSIENVRRGAHGSILSGWARARRRARREAPSRRGVRCRTATSTSCLAPRVAWISLGVGSAGGRISRVGRRRQPCPS